MDDHETYSDILLAWKFGLIQLTSVEMIFL